MDNSGVEHVRDQLRSLVFRRVHAVQPYQLLSSRFYTAPDVWRDDAAEWTAAEWEKNIEQRYGSYYGFTSPVPVRANDTTYAGVPLYFNKLHFGILDPVTLAVKHTEPEEGDGPSSVPPRPGDLLCGRVVPSPSAKHQPFFDCWFLCSEQFYRAWTLAMYPEHSSFHKAEKKKCGARSFWMSGNRLMTSTYRKWLLGCAEDGLEPSDEEKCLQYWHPRCENAAREWVHLYCAIVLLVRYQEIPGPENVPTVKGPDRRLTAWDLPNGFVAKFLAFHQQKQA